MIAKDDYKLKTETYYRKTRWLSFYIYFRLPAAIFFEIISISSNYKYLQTYSPRESFGLNFTVVIIISSLLILYRIIIIIQMNKLKPSGFIMNMIYIVIEVFIFAGSNASKRDDFIYSFLIGIVSGLIAWVLPNYIYFIKRKSLFYENPEEPETIDVANFIAQVNGYRNYDEYENIILKKIEIDNEKFKALPLASRLDLIAKSHGYSSYEIMLKTDGRLQSKLKYLIMDSSNKKAQFNTDDTEIEEEISEPFHQSSMEVASPIETVVLNDKGENFIETSDTKDQIYYCRKCGYKVPLDSVFCPKCGIKIII